MAQRNVLIKRQKIYEWAKATYANNGYYRVDNIRYDIFANMPSDGISLWYDYLGSVQAYHSPVNPSTQYTHVLGHYWIESGKGALVARVTSSALVNGFPVIKSHYSVRHI